jgi:hypothetical protein
MGLVFFGFRFRPGKARVGMALSGAGLFIITITLFDFSRDVISRIFTVVQVGAWPSLGFFGTGYFIAWLAILAALLSILKSRKPALVNEERKSSINRCSNERRTGELLRTNSDDATNTPVS